MSNDNTGGPAFPTPRYERGDMYSLGMTIRDYFAAKAMQGFFSDHRVLQVMSTGTTSREMELARSAYEMADAMINERDKTK